MKHRYMGKTRVLSAFLALVLALACTMESSAFSPEDLTIPDCAEAIVYGVSGQGRDLTAYKFGQGENVLVAGFCIHGWEDVWAGDGEALVYTAGELMSLLAQRPEALADGGWTMWWSPAGTPPPGDGS